MNKQGIESVKPLYLIVKNLVDCVEKIRGSTDKYLVADESNKKVVDIFDKLFKFVKNKISRFDRDEIIFGSSNDEKICDVNKIRFSSDVDLPLNTLVEFHY